MATPAQVVEKELAKLKAFDAKNQVIAKKAGASNEDRELNKLFFKALASKSPVELSRVNDLIAKDYEQKAQTIGTVGSGTAGGILVPTTLADSIITKIKYISPMRQISNVLENVPERLELPQENALPTTYWVGEATAPTESGSTFTKPVLAPGKLAGLDSFSHELLEAAATSPGVQAFVENRFAVSMALAENDAFVNGDGSNKPFGFRSSQITPNSANTAGAALAFNDLTLLKYTQPTAYRALSVFLTSSLGMQVLENIKDTSGRPIFREGLTEGTPATLLGRPIYVVDEIPSNLGTGTNETEIWYGLFSQSYIIGDREALRIDYGTNGTDFAQDKISLRMIRRVGGLPVLGESFSVLNKVK